MGRKRLRAVRGALALTVIILVTSAPIAAQAAGPILVGAGSTWSQIAIDQWRGDVYRYGLQINYQGVGSTTGRAFFIQDTVDFGVSEIPFQPEDGTVTRKFKYLPIVAGGTSLMYNLHSPSGAQIRNLQLSSQTIAQILTGQITNWSDPAIKKDYGAALPNLPIKVVVRSDGSGTSAQLSAYIAAMQPSTWRSFTAACGIPDKFTSFWPFGQTNCLQQAIAEKGSDGIANYVANPGLGVGAIGYVEAGYAIGRRFPVVAVKNQSGHFVLPTAQNVATALTHTILNSDSTSNLSHVYVAPESNAYPISSYSYMIVPTDNTISTDKGAVLGKFIIYFACTGQQEAARLGYSPMPKQLVQFAFDAERAVPGAPKPPAITYATCPNPTLNGSLGAGGGGTTIPGSENPGGTTAGAGGASPSTAPSSTAGGGSTSVETVTQTPAVLSSDAVATLQLAADEQIGGLRSASPAPFIVGAALLLLVVFAPLLGLRLIDSRRARRPRHRV